MGSAALHFPIVATALLAACGCSIVTSEHPVWDEKSSKVDDRLIGVWRPLREKSSKASNDRMLVLIGKHRTNGQLMSLTMVGSSGLKGEPDRLKVETYPMIASPGTRNYLSLDIMPAEKSGKRSAFYIMEYELAKTDQMLKVRHLQFDAVRKLVKAGELKGAIRQPPVRATKPGDVPNAADAGRESVEIQERSRRLREVLLRHPEVAEDEWIHAKRVSAEEFERFLTTNELAEETQHASAGDWRIIVGLCIGLVLGAAGAWLARRRRTHKESVIGER